MSSAVLYLAIVAIWACVLIPRWLRRDSARGAGGAADTPVPGDGDAVAAEDASGGDVPAAATPPGPVYAESVRDEAVADRAAEHAGAAGETDTGAPPLTPEESRQRMLAARRRLLGMLVLLQIAAITLAVLRLAALWVVIPPSVMLIGYLLLLREAAHADAERTQRAQEAAARARAMARERDRARARATRRTAAPAAVAAGHEDSGPGRDFAPGLAGKYTTSNAEVITISGRADEAVGDRQYRERKLRAVGD